MPAPPELTPDQRRQALEKAAEARRRRAQLKGSLKTGETSLKELFDRADGDEVIGKMKVQSLIESMPGVGRVRAQRIMEKLQIKDSRRVRGLGDKQRQNLLDEFSN